MLKTSSIRRVSRDRGGNRVAQIAELIPSSIHSGCYNEMEGPQYLPPEDAIALARDWGALVTVGYFNCHGQFRSDSQPKGYTPSQKSRENTCYHCGNKIW